MRLLSFCYAALLFGLTFAPLAVQAQMVFQCDIGKKRLEITLEDGLATYSFGQTGAPDLVISTAPADLVYVPWNGIGVDMPEAVQFVNKGTVYEVWYSVRKLLDDAEVPPPPTGGVRVLQGDQVLADLLCSTPPSVSDLYLIYDAKLAAGQCYDWETQSWGSDCSG